MKRKLLTVLIISAMVLTGNTVARADDVFDSNTEKSSDMDTEEQTEANPENTISILDEIDDEVLNEEKDTENFITAYADGIAIDEEYFPDENFRKYLKDNFDENGDGYFSQDEMDSVTSIDMLYTGNGTIENLVGINHFKNLTSLNCSGKQLMEIDVSQNPNLQTLDCHYNQIKSLDVSQNPNLATLNCGANQLTALDVSQNPNLITLKCDNNHQIKLLDVSQNPNLQTLDCNFNQIAELDVSQNPSLITLNCNHNEIKALDVSKSLNLQTLDCYNNQITELNVSQNPNLETLDCSSNRQISKLDVSRNPNLTTLSCSSNQITTLDVSQNPNLETLSCGFNYITELDVSKNLNLSTLFCDGNQIKSLDVSNNLNLSRLGCPSNQLKELNVSKNVNLKELRCQNNHLTNLDLSYNENMLIRGDRKEDGVNIVSASGAHVIPQNINANIVSTDGTWTLELAAIVGKENLSRVTLVTDGAKMSADGIVTFSGSTMPTELVYNYDTKNPAEDTPMTVHVTLTQKNVDDQTGNNVDDQTGKDVTVDTGDLDIDKICKENNISINANFEIILSQGTPSKESLDKLTQAAGKNGYSIKATYEILMSLLSDGQKIADITDNFGRIKLTFQVDASLAGQNAIVYQLHNNSQVIVHDGLTINTDGTVTITVDKFSTFAVAVKPSSNNTGKPDTDQSGTNKPDTNSPDTNKPGSNRPDTNQPDTNQPNGNQPDTNRLAPKTGDSTNPAFWIIVAMVASITGILNRKRFYKN